MRAFRFREDMPGCPTRAPRQSTRVHGEVHVQVTAPATRRAVLDAVVSRFPALRGTIRDRASARRRAFIRLHGCEEDLSHDEPDTALPKQVARGEEPFIVLGAMAGG